MVFCVDFELRVRDMPGELQSSLRARVHDLGFKSLEAESLVFYVGVLMLVSWDYGPLLYVPTLPSCKHWHPHAAV